MHILLAILGGLGTLAFFLYRLGMFSRNASELVDTAEKAHGAWRRHKFRKRAERPALESEDDPRAGAAAVAVSIVQCAGQISAEQEQALRQEFETVLQTDDSEELLSYARWLTKDVIDPNTVSARLAELFNTQLGPTQKHELIDMVTRLSTDDPVQIEAIRHLKSRLGMEH
ncbi:MAG: hypothetical protein ACR2PM_07075 [Hyphomicrobiales bacterium]